MKIVIPFLAVFVLCAYDLNAQSMPFSKPANDSGKIYRWIGSESVRNVPATGADSILLQAFSTRDMADTVPRLDTTQIVDSIMVLRERKAVELGLPIESEVDSALFRSLGERLDVPDVRVDSSVWRNATNPENLVSEAGKHLPEAADLQEYINKLPGEDELNEVEHVEETAQQIAEEHASEVDELAELQKQRGLSAEELEKYKKALEEYKNEKQITDELIKKSKDLATDVVMKNQSKVNESMQKLAKIKRKFSNVPDVRYLPKRPPNPMKGLGWRERVVPGMGFQLMTGTRTSLQFDPQVSYRFFGNFLAGGGGMYRFSVNKDKRGFSDFGNLYGAKVFVQYQVFNEFFLRAEGQQAVWKPWDMRAIDPGYRERTYVGAVGIGREYSVSHLLKGNMQLLYHDNRVGSDPYRPRIMVRMEFDLSLKKEEKLWKKKWNEVRKKQRESLRNRYNPPPLPKPATPPVK